jgi:hypothetical protein
MTTRDTIQKKLLRLQEHEQRVWIPTWVILHVTGDKTLRLLLMEILHLVDHEYTDRYLNSV